MLPECIKIRCLLVETFGLSNSTLLYLHVTVLCKIPIFIDNLFNDFISLSGDRFYGEDKSVISGFAKFQINQF